MSNKRQATTELNHDNWDQDDPAEEEEMGAFKSAPKDILEKRVMKTARRRTQASGDETKKSVFSGFGGFNKPPPSSFDFLSNLTNGSKPTNGSTNSPAQEPPASGGLFSMKPAAPTAPAAGLFTMPVTTTSPAKHSFGIPSTQSAFGGSATTFPAQSPFGAKKTDTPTQSPFKMESPKLDANNDSKAANSSATFGSSAVPNKSPFAAKTNSNPFKIQSNDKASANDEKPDKEQNEDDEDDDAPRLRYYNKLRGLNESVADWIKKHVDETPLCILSPIFKDYEKHLKEMKDEYHATKKPEKASAGKPVEDKPAEVQSNNIPKTSPFGNSSSSLFSATKPSMFGSQSSNPPTADKPGGFSFGTTPISTTTTTSGGFSFGINSTPQTTAATSAPFSFTTSTASDSNPTASFSFGTGKPFSFNNIQKPAETATENKEEEDDQPPKVEYNPIVEENSVFDKKCKIFVKKDGNFIDKGIGTLYLKKIEDTEKYQLLVRANTTLGNILVNLVLSSNIPTQRLGKNNVMMMCIPTPEAKPPPTPVLIRVKTSEEADQLLETLDKHKA